MIVFADRMDPVCPRRQLDELAKRLSDLKNCSEGITSHAAHELIYRRCRARSKHLRCRIRKAGKDTSSAPPGRGHVVSDQVATDNRLHQWEWLVRDDGSILKTDSIDHCSAHDLIGCQDIAWDVAGAIVEFAFSASEGEDLAARVEKVCGQTVSLELIEFFIPCYLAFQLGYYSLAAGTAISDAADTRRLQARANLYRDFLARHVGLRNR